MTSKNKQKSGSQCLAERDGLIDLRALNDEIEALVAKFDDAASAQCKNAFLACLKKAVTKAHAHAEKLLLKDGSGLKCANRISSFQDELIGIIHHFAIRHVFNVEDSSADESMVIVAVGGYGRGTLAPGSDIDLLFILPHKQTPWGESVVEYNLYMLWDLGFKVGHATRNVNECIRLSLQDMTIRTAMLEARFLHGEKDLFDHMEERFRKEVVHGTSAQFIEAKMAESDKRHNRAGGSRYLVEPNLKEGKGGLRDLHTLFWISKYFYQVKKIEQLLEKGVFNKDEYKLFMKATDFLWAIRCHLHYLTDRPEERLSFDLQREMAKRLNYKSHGGLLDVERFMKHYFLVAKSVGDLTNILSTKLEQNHVKKAPALSRLMAALRRRRPSALKGSDTFLIENNRIIHAHDDIFKNDPVNMLRAFEAADKTGLTFHPDLLHLMARSLKLITKEVRADSDANAIFLKILCSKRDPETLLRKMNESGVLGRFIPDFGKVIAMMQFNMYHHYTVDEHTIRSIGMLASIVGKESGDEHPLAHKVIDTVDDPFILYIALFLHDIAKGRPEDHSVAGAKVALRICKRFQLKKAQTETISWLVLEHLTMSIIAQSRDLSDPQTIRDFANIVQTPERLKLLLILTICDIKAVGPGVWNGWKGQLLRTLYYETQTLLTGGHSSSDAKSNVDEVLKTLDAALSHWDEADRIAYTERHYPAYLLRTDIETLKQHAEFILSAQGGEMPLATMTRTLAFEGVTEFTVYAPDQPNMLSLMAGACARAGTHIVDAQVYTTRDGFAIDTIRVRREFKAEEDEMRRAERISNEIKEALAGIGADNDGAIHVRAAQKSNKAFSVPTEIIIDNTLSNRFSVIETSGKDRIGLLHDLASVIFDLNLNISSAHIATFGERAVDVFYVTDLLGEKITNKGRQNKIKKRLEKVFDPTPSSKSTKKAA